MAACQQLETNTNQYWRRAANYFSARILGEFFSFKVLKIDFHDTSLSLFTTAAIKVQNHIYGLILASP